MVNLEQQLGILRNSGEWRNAMRMGVKLPLHILVYGQ